MIVREAYRDRRHRVCREHWHGAKPLPADAPVLGPVIDSRSCGCEFCEDLHPCPACDRWTLPSDKPCTSCGDAQKVTR